MLKSPTYTIHFTLLVIVLLVCFIINICLGSVTISFSDTVHILFGTVSEDSSNSYIVWQYRLPKAITAILVGGGLSLSGLLMQT
ncbi:MAG: iron chelate uptake ABC transporter family permease subunit, partial [Maribacter stanieri]